MLARALRLLRVFHEEDQASLARALGISRSYLSELESGKKQPTLELLQRYATHFSIPVSSILLLSERLVGGKISERLRVKAAKKVLTILELVAPKTQARDAGTVEDGSGERERDAHEAV